MKMQQIVVVKNKVKKVRWTKFDPNMKAGNKIKLKDEKGLWNILLVFTYTSQKIN
jgi:hypothetical protein